MRLHLRVSLPLVLAFASACSGASATSDAGPSQPSTDAGPIDAGPLDAGAADAGVVDAGPAPGTVALSVASNPNSVLSAVATVQASANVASVHLEVEDPDGSVETTPEVALDGGRGVLPVLGLRPTTSYALTAVGTLPSLDVSVRSAPASFETAELPQNVPVYSVADGGLASAGFTLVARVPTVASGGSTVTLCDGSGRPLWYLTHLPGLVGDFQRQPDGSYTFAVDDPAHVVTGLAESPAIYEQFDVLGNLLHTWRSPDALATDDHELRVQPNGDALLFGFETQTVDMSQLADGGLVNATVVGDLLERITPDGGVAFRWSSFDHLDLADIDPTVSRTTAVVDAVHANAIDVTSDGDYLISVRDMSEVVKIDPVTGDVVWKLGGLSSDFSFVGDPLGGFSLQHGARELANGDILLFDDGNGHQPPQSRAVEYALDTTAMTATLVWSDEDSPALYAYAMGYAQRLANGNTLVCYGTASRVQEVDASGKLLWDLGDPSPGFGFYRAYRLDSLY